MYTYIAIIVLLIILAVFIMISLKRNKSTIHDIVLNTAMLGMGILIGFCILLIGVSFTDNGIKTKIANNLITESISKQQLYPLSSGAYYDDITEENSFIINTVGEGETSLRAYSGNISLKYDATEYPYVEFITTSKNEEEYDKLGIIANFFRQSLGDKMVIHLYADDNSDELNKKSKDETETSTEDVKTSDYLDIETNLDTEGE